MRQRKLKGIESRKSRYGLMFVMPWIIGFILFFATPLFQSVTFALSEVSFGHGGVKIRFSGFKNVLYLFNEDPNFQTLLKNSIFRFIYSLPLILIISMVIALFLNQKFFGRLFFRSLFFLPVIIASGVVIQLMFLTTSSDLTSTGVSESLTSNMFTVKDIMRNLNLPVEIAKPIQTAISNIFNLIWSSGVQIVLFISGFQAISSSIYEACKVEGATKWEEFWFITVPMMGRIILLVFIYTMIDIFTDKQNPIVSKAYSLMSTGEYDQSSTMLWIFFVIVGAIMAILIGLYNKYLASKWE